MLVGETMRLIRKKQYFDYNYDYNLQTELLDISYTYIYIHIRHRDLTIFISHGELPQLDNSKVIAKKIKNKKLSISK